jgi:hypothetical protein
MIEVAATRESLAGFTFDHLAKGLDNAAPGSAYGPIFRGRRCAMMARNASQVRNDARFRTQAATQIREAEEWLEKAYAIDPMEPRASTFMLRIYDDIADRGMATPADEAAWEKWFDRAMKANPDNYEACNKRFQQLMARYSESPEPALAFVEKCRQTRNWRGRLPFIVADFHQLMALRSKDRITYFSQPQVWEAIGGVYAEHLQVFPADVNVRSYYARAATQCRQWAVAREQFQILGDKPDMSVFGSIESYDYLRRKAERLAGQAKN